MKGTLLPLHEFCDGGSCKPVELQCKVLEAHIHFAACGCCMSSEKMSMTEGHYALMFECCMV